MARVLVVEDEANNLDVAQRIIRASGHEALSAVDGVSALDVARAERPDAILMDLLLPRLDGFSVARALRAEDWAAHVPIIAVSALSHPGDRARALEAGCDDFVSKPYAPAELRAILVRYLPTTAPAGGRGGAPAPPAGPPGRPPEGGGRGPPVDRAGSHAGVPSRPPRCIAGRPPRP